MRVFNSVEVRIAERLKMLKIVPFIGSDFKDFGIVLVKKLRDPLDP